MTLNFNNPTVVTETEGVNISDLFNLEETPTKEPIKPNLKEKKEKAPVKDEPVEKVEEEVEETEEEKEEETKDEDSESSDDNESDPPVVKTINYLHEKGIITEAYEGFDDEEEMTDEVLTKLLEHNLSKKVDESLSGFIGQFSDLTRRVMKYDFDAKGKDVDSFVRTLLEEQNIKNLDVANEYDQEKIVKQWMQKDGFTTAEIEERITDLKEGNLLEKEAKRLKPKLDSVAAEIAAQKEKEQEEIRKFEEKVKENYKNRVVDLLSKGSVKGVSLTKEDATSVYEVLTNDEVELTLPGNRKVKMPALEAMLYHHRYDKAGSLDNVILATLLLTNPDKFEEAFKKRATNDVTKKFVTQHKNSKLSKPTQTDNSIGWGKLKF